MSRGVYTRRGMKSAAAKVKDYPRTPREYNRSEVYDVRQSASLQALELRLAKIHADAAMKGSPK